MKIVYLVHRGLFAYSGGGHVHVTELIRALERAGHQVQVLASDSGEPLTLDGAVAVVPQRDSVSDAKGLMRRLAGRSLWQRLRGIRAQARFRAARPRVEQALREMRAEAVYERYSLYNSSGVDTCQALGIPHVLEVNSLCETLEQYGDHTYDPAAIRLERHIFATTGRVLVVSEAVRDAVLRQHPQPERVVVVPNGVDLSRFHPEIDGTDVRDANGLGGRVVIGMVAYFKRWHGLEQLLQAVPSVVEACPSVQFLLVGEGDRPGAVSDFVHVRGMSQWVSVTGEVPHAEIPSYVAAMDITVIPHFHHHGSPLKLFEYMAAGKPTVAVAIGQICEVLQDGTTGLLVPPDDISALSGALIRLAQDRTLRQQMGAAARAWVARERSWDDVARRVLQLWDEQRKSPQPGK